jgi:hypothetical protein
MLFAFIGIKNEIHSLPKKHLSLPINVDIISLPIVLRAETGKSNNLE